MAGKGGKGGKAVWDWVPVSSKQESPKGKNGAPLKELHVEIESSDSDGEGFIDTIPTSPNLNGKSSAELKSGKKKVSFGSTKLNEKDVVDTPTAKGDLGKGGKNSNVGKAGGKGSLPKATPVKPLVTEVDLKLELELPNSAKLLMDCEAAEVLQDIQDHMTVLSEDPKIKMPESFSKALQYSKLTGYYTNAQSVRQVLETLKLVGVTDGEICMIGNVCPETIDEVYALIPSLKENKHKNEGAITEALASLARFRTSN
ncbi:DNA-directed RNA polymerases IV and V subunit 4 isoform X2 [Canna indica]|uniref:DNA-directed RNA polymerases IV and V subunit 4 isoform X2 n=1 Tax=Canna indica TaxID=4628 RepID=A0AAQ3Q3P9_9LILI|nr:DNA-directed RNA polymerases IV and V subunit 4 isoform X2 [Canna indica]